MKVSLVIPVYNAAGTIDACIDCVLAQTLDDVEVIIIDDCSTDGSMEIVRRKLQDYFGPKLFRFGATAVHSGPGAARNCGLTLVSGEFVAFFDADDYIVPDYLELLHSAAVRADADIAFGLLSLDFPGGQSILYHNPHVEDGPFVGAVKRRYLRHIKAYPPTHIYRSAFLKENGISFPGTYSAEDSCMLFCSLLCASRIASDERACYHYNILPGTTSRRRDTRRWLNRLRSLYFFRRFAFSRPDLRRYRAVSELLVIKKGWIMALRDFISNNLKPESKSE